MTAGNRTAGKTGIANGCLAAAALLCGMAGVGATAQSQPPYLLPYTIQVLAGGGTSVPVAAGASSPCLGAGGGALQYDQYGDGCPVSSSSVVVGAASDLHDVVVDAQGNVYFLDNSSANGVVRRIDAHSGVVTVYAGSYATQTNLCAATQDKYGDGCAATDGRANAGSNASGNTGGFGKARGLGIGRNGDVYIADYGTSVAHRISAATGIMTAVAGTLSSSTKLSGNGGVKGFTGDGGQGFNAAATPTPQGAGLNAERGIGVDAAGNIYIADSTNNVIRKVTLATGIITTVVGSDANAPNAANPAVVGTANGDGGPAGAALLLTPEDVEVDARGNIFIADQGTSRVRVVYFGGAVVANLIAKTNNGLAPVVGNIYSVVGSGVVGTATPGPALATTVPIAGVRKISLDAFGNIFVADNGNNVIWFVDASTGFMRVIAGQIGLTVPPSLCPGHADNFNDNCPAASATLNPVSAMGVSVDGAENLYISDSGDARLRRVSTNQTFPATASGATVLQTLQVHFAPGDGPASDGPFVLAGSPDFSAGAPSCSVNPDGTQDCLLVITFRPTLPGVDTGTLITKSALNGTAAFGITGVGLAATVALDPGRVTVLATTLKNPQGVAQDAAGNVYVADTANNRIVELPAGGTAITIAGTGASGFSGDGAAATAAALNGPRGVAVSRSGLIYIADTGNNVVRQVNPASGVISTVAGGASAACAISLDTQGDGCPGTAATFSGPTGLATDPDGNLYIADTGNSLIRELTVSGSVFLYAGGSTGCGNNVLFGNGCPAAQAIFKNPTGLQVDSNRNVFVADTGNNQVREIVAGSGIVNAIAGTGVSGGSGNGGPATGAQLAGPTGVSVDAAGNVYIADTGNQVIRAVNGSGNINSVVGTLGGSGTGVVPGLSTGVLLSGPSGVVSNGAGTLTVLDAGNNRLLSDLRLSVAFSFPTTNPGTSSPTFAIQQTSTGSLPLLIGAGGNGLFTPASAAPFTLTGTGSTGCSAGSQPFTPGASCLLTASFAPMATQLGPFAATFTENTTPGLTPAPSIQLTGVAGFVTATSSITGVTSPATGSPQYPVPFTVTTTVTPLSCNKAAPSCFPSGTVSFFVNGTQVGVPVALSATGVASLPIPGQSVGSYAVTAVYSGDSSYSSSSAPAITVTVTVGATTTTVSASPASGRQFDPITLTANVAPTSSVQTTSLPTGNVTFKASAGGATITLGTASVSPTNGVATIADIFVAATKSAPAHLPNSFGLPAGTYQLTAVYAGDANYAPSTSSVGTLTINADAPGFTVALTPATAGTAQGSTATVVATVTPTNTFSGTVAFTCTNLPAHATCTFGPPTSLSFTPVLLVPAAQQINITLFTDVPAGVTQTLLKHGGLPGRQSTEPAFAALLGFPAMFFAFGTMVAFRRRLRGAAASLCALFLLAGLAALSGCSGGAIATQATPVGTYTINVVATGPNGLTVSTPITFVVGPGAPGQL